MKNNINFSQIRKKIKNKKSTISVIGLGYIGLPLSLAFVKSGFKVIGIDKDQRKIKSLNSKKSYISTISDLQIKKALRKNFTATTKFNNISKSDIIITCVPTPIDKNKKPALNDIANVVSKIKKYLKKNQLYILECTSYPGTSEEFFLPVFKKNKLQIGKNIFLGYSPEREDPGNLNFSIIKGNLSKVVSGYSNHCKTLVQDLYSNIIDKIHPVSSIKTAEFTKLLENIYRSVNVGLVNELFQISSKMDINIYEAIKAASTKPFGFKPFYPGPGVGGHCIPVDPHFLSWKAKQYNLQTKFINLASLINDNRPKEITKKIKNYFKKKNNITKKTKIVIGGFSYKKNSDDTRESPAIEIYRLIKKIFKKNIMICDPFIQNKKDKNFNKFEFIDIKKLKNKNFLKSLKFFILVTDHDVFDYDFISKNTKVVFDCRNGFKSTNRNVLKV